MSYKMGADGSKASNKAKFANLSPETVEKATRELNKITGGQDSLDRVTFEHTFIKMSPITGRLFDQLQVKQRVPLTKLLSTADAMAGDAAEQAEILIAIHGNNENIITQLVHTLAAQNKFSALETSNLLTYLVNELPETARLDRWLVSSPIAHQLVKNVYSPLSFTPPTVVIPHLVGSSKLFSAPGLLIINAHLPMERRKEWTSLFSSTQHGSSFSKMFKQVNGEGPCVVVVESEDGRVFGCFASDGFLVGPKYRGDATCFLFTIQPDIQIYSATGFTKNYAYLNYQQASLPNGLGIGGDKETWPFFIKEEYGKGYSQGYCSSFEKCWLSGKNEFSIRTLEVWRVGEKPKLTEEEEEKVKKEKSIIDKDPEAKAMLEMSGRTLHSEAYREAAPILDDDDDIVHRHHKK